MSTEVTAARTIGEQVTCTVERVMPYGVIVRLADGIQGYIRCRELSMARDISPSEVVSEGEEIQAVIVALAEQGRRMELSRRAVLPDPWLEFCHRHRVGSVVKGTVKVVRPYGVFLEILPGLNGLVPKEELATWRVQQIHDLVWIGDNVEAVITHMDSKRKHLKLSIRSRMKQLSTAASVLEHLSQVSATEIQTEPVDDLESPVEEDLAHRVGVSQLQTEHVGRILVVEDDHDLRLSLVEWFRQRGWQADGAASTGAALEKLQEQAYGVVFVDIDLPGSDGLSLIRQLREEGNSVCVVVMSIVEWLTERTQEIDELQVDWVLLKPLDLDEIEELLFTVGSGESLAPQRKRYGVMPEGAEYDSYQRLAGIMHSGFSLVERLQDGLEHLTESTEAEVGLVFRMDPTSRKVSIVARSGTASLNSAAVCSLGESPVRDVIQQKTPVLEGWVLKRAENRFRKLLDLLFFESCIGVPIEVSGETHHALFLFSEEPGSLSHRELRDAQTVGVLFSVALESQALEERIQSVNRVLLSGQLSAGFSHEVHNKISGLEIQLLNLWSGCEELSQQIPSACGSSVFRNLKQAMDRVLGTATELKHTADLFQRLMKAEQCHDLDVNEVVLQAETQMRPLARKGKTRIQLSLDTDLPIIPGSAIRLRQALLNVMLNALQQMEHKPEDGRLMEIATTYEPEDDSRPVRIRLFDTGPGIHRKLWEQVFALGFTTRVDGSGLGLYIARSLIASMGGQISVEESLVPLGATFLVELPAAEEESRGHEPER